MRAGRRPASRSRTWYDFETRLRSVPVARDLLGRDRLRPASRPSARRGRTCARRHEGVAARGRRARARPRWNPRLLGHRRDDRLEEVVERAVALQVVGDLEDLVERLGALAVALGELLDLRADRAVLQDEGDVVGDRRERGQRSRARGASGEELSRTSRPECSSKVERPTRDLVGRVGAPGGSRARRPTAISQGDAARSTRRSSSRLRRAQAAELAAGGLASSRRGGRRGPRRRRRSTRAIAIASTGSSRRERGEDALVAVDARARRRRCWRCRASRRARGSARETSRTRCSIEERLRMTKDGEHDREERQEQLRRRRSGGYTRISRTTIGASSRSATSWKRAISSRRSRGRPGPRARGRRRRAPCSRRRTRAGRAAAERGDGDPAGAGGVEGRGRRGRPTP